MNQEILNILVIDDEELDRVALQRSIRASGFTARIVTTSDRESSIDALTHATFDCIFLDYNLPDCTGLEFFDSNRSIINHTPVIIVTSHGDEKLAVEAMRMGACDYISKKLITPEGVAQSIRYALKINEARLKTSRMQKALIASERNLDAVIEKSPILLFAVDHEGTVSMLKGKCMELLHVSPEEIVGKTMAEVRQIIPFESGMLKSIMKLGEYTTTVEVNDRHFELTCIQQYNEFELPDGFVGIATDITKLKNTEINLMNDLHLAKETQHVKEQFLANMSHEIRTPIHGITSLTNLLLKTQIDQDQLTFLNAIKKSADNLLVIINDILDLSKMDARKMTFESTVFNIQEIVDTTYELFKAKASEKGIALKRSNDECIPGYVKGDPTRLSQIINNLVNNAIKFTNHGEVEITSKLVESNERCSMISVSVRDTGIGIPKDKLSTIFDMFTQAGDDITRKYGGTGLGLSIAKNLIDLQGGIIKVDSEPGMGTTFTFSLPFDHPDPAELEAHHAQSEEPESRIDKGLRILIVEDNDINRLVINKMMKDWGLQIDNAVNGLDALNKIRKNDYDIVLMDIEMPEMNGYQCIREIRTSLKAPKCDVSVMAMTAHANAKERDKCLQLGMNDYISKPFDPLNLKQKIAALGNKKELAETNAEIVSEPVVVNATESTAEKVTNLDYLRVLAEDNVSFFTDFINLFLTNTPEILNDLELQLKNKNWEGVRQAAHKVKPSLNYLGMKPANQLAATIEECAKECINLEKVPGYVTELTSMCQAAFNELKAELKSAALN
jgi:signal transduction histidine kinase/CheY-like chemotaxis protein/HPt (histidine-containing phosphotransfer) domain-containing protein